MRAVEDSYWWYTGLRTRVVESLLHALDTNNKLRMLDVGCGTGGMMSCLPVHISPMLDIIGIDYSDQAAWNNPGTRCWKGC